MIWVYGSGRLGLRGLDLAALLVKVELAGKGRHSIAFVLLVVLSLQSVTYCNERKRRLTEAGR